jgi:NAD(P)-dependent dehydrogenase (short-subunit alcohol dehydrogenase family)
MMGDPSSVDARSRGQLKWLATKVRESSASVGLCELQSFQGERHNRMAGQPIVTIPPNPAGWPPNGCDLEEAQRAIRSCLPPGRDLPVWGRQTDGSCRSIQGERIKAMSLAALLKGKGNSGFGYGSTADEVTQELDLTGRRYLVTGSTSGLGAETVRVLIARGATVLSTARTMGVAKANCETLGVRAVPFALELSEPASVRGCVAEVSARGEPLDGIITNAGIMALPKRTVQHGLELQFLTNHIGHFLLVTALLPLLSPKGRVVVLSSSAHNMAPSEGIQFDNLDGSRSYSPWVAYGQSKLANLLFAKALALRLPSPEQTANAVHPGVINTGLQRSMNSFMAGTLRLMGPLFLKDIPQGAATQTFVATHPSVANVRGEYFADCNVSKCSKLASDTSLAERLWETSEQIVANLR